MKIFKVVVVLASLLCSVAPVWAQFTIFMMETDQVLTTTCGGTTPIPDGTQVQIIWDRGVIGESAEDTLAPLCSNPPACLTGPPQTVTLNTFVMNGAAVELGAGYFVMENSLGSVGTIISPNAFYLRICLPTVHWVSNTIQNLDGYQEVEMGPWTCVAAPCAGCPAPPAITTLLASDDASCHGVSLTWTYPDTVANLDRFYIYRAGTIIDSTGPLVRAYTDSTAVPQTTYLYAITARRHCLDGTNGYSTPVSDEGSRHASPPIATSVTATTNTCDSVRVSWTYNTNAGIDSFIVRRDGTRVGAIVVTGSAGPRFWYHVTSARGTGQYSVVGRNPVCGEGTPSASATGEAQQEPLAVIDVVATDGQCDSTVVTWADAANETSYHVYRSLADGTNIIDLTSTGLAAGTVRYRDASGTYGTNYRYWVVAINGCGSSLASVYDLGSRVTTPTAPGSFLASDAAFCTHTAMTWADIATESGYQILRNLNTVTDTIATLPANTTSYNDSLGSPGTVYNYSVRAINGCGAAISIANAGSRLTVPPQITTLTATDGTLCSSVTLTWTNVASEQGYRVYRDSALITSTNVDVTTYTDNTAAPGVHYGYAVLAYNTCGNGVPAAVDSGYARALPGQVTGLSASDTSCGFIHLAWTDVAGDTAYQVFRGGTLIGSTAANVTNYSDAGAGAGSISYYVVAMNGCGSAPASATVTGSRLPSTPAVTGIVATDNRCDSVLVTWTDIAGEDSFAVQRDGVLIGRVPQNATTFAYLPPDSNVSHTYTVAGYNNCGLGTVGTGDAGTRLGRPAQVQGVVASEDSCTNVRISWSTLALVDSFVVRRDGVRLGATAAGVTSFTDASGVPGTVYNYTVQAYSVCGGGAVSAADAGNRLIAPTLPQNLAASVNHCDRVSLSWTASAGDVDHYKIYRDATLVTTIAGTLTTYDDAAAPTGVSSYTVSAVSDQCGETALSTAALGERLVTPGVPPSVTATNNLCTGVQLSWGTTTGDVDSFRVYQDGIHIASVAAGVLTYLAVPGTAGSYQYRIAAYSNDCALEGGQSTAITGVMLTPPTAVSGIQVSTTRCDGIRLSWVQGTGAVTGYIIVRDGVEIDTAAASADSYNDSGAADGVHSYVIRTYSATCSEPTPPTAVAGVRQVAPTAPTAVAATTTQCDSVIVTWTASTGTLDSYKVYRDGALLATISGTLTRFADLTISGVDYRYTVRAFDDVCGETDSTAGATGRRISDVGVPQTVTATPACAGVLVAWTASTGVPQGYRIYRNDVFLIEVASTATSYTDTAAAYGSNYTYKVLSFSALCGETAFSNTATAARIPLPTQVVGLSASTINCSGVALQWDAVTGAAQYKIYRDGSVLDSVAVGTTSYTDTSVVPRVSHSYTVAAQNACSLGVQSVAASGSRADVPDVVTGLAASDTSCAAVRLAWTDVATETRYVITRDGSVLDSVNAGVLIYSDATAVAGTPYVYAIVAKNTCGAAAASATATGTRVQSAAQVTGVTASTTFCDSVHVTWADLTNETGYHIYRDGGLVGTVGAGVLAFGDLLASPGTHNYTVAGVNACGEGPVSAAVQGIRTTVPPQVTGGTATVDSCTSITLTWTDVTTELKYYIYRGGVLRDSTLADITTYRDNALAPGAYTYTIVPKNDCGLGASSAVINGRVASVPAVVTNIVATGNRCDSVIVTWTDSPDELNYEVVRNGTSLGFLTANTVRFADRPDSGQVISYQIRAINACGQGALNTPAASGYRQKLPIQVLNVAAIDTACTAIRVTWTNVPNALGYYVYRDGTLVATQTDTLAGTAQDATPPVGTFQYTVQAYNVCGNGPVSTADAGTRLPTMAAVVLSTASTTYCDSIVVTWQNLTGELGYRVLRDDVQIAELAADITRYNDIAATVGVHNYKVIAFNLCGPGASSNVLAGTRLGAPAAVTNVVATDNSCTNVVITWANVTGESGYRIYRDGVIIGTTTVDVTTYTDTPTAGIYLYGVRSYNACDSALLVTDQGIRQTVPLQVTGVAATTTRCDSIIVTWTDLTSDSAYQILRGGIQIASVLQNVVRYADAPAAGTYQYAVRAINRCGTGPNSVEVTGTRVQAPSVPASIAVRDSCGMVGIRWGAATGAVNSYYIYRGTTVVHVVSADTTDRFWVDHVAAGTYAYSVRAHSNLCGDGPATAPVNGTSIAAPSTPTNVQVAPAMCDSIRLTWTASTGTVAGYIIRRDLAVVDTVATLRFVDTEVNDGRSHVYTVAAYNNVCGQTTPSGVVFGRMRPLLEITTEIPDTLHSAQMYRVDYQRCGGVQTDSVFLSLSGGAYNFLDILSATQLYDSVLIPMVANNSPNSRLRLISTRGTRKDTLTSDPFVVTPPLAVGLPVTSTIPTEFFLDQNYPNPFNPLTSIRFGVPRAAEVKVVVYDLTGREIETIVNETMQPGVHTVMWDCSHCPSGMYMLRLESPDRVLMRKMLLMK